MSSDRKRSALKKANERADSIESMLKLRNFHYEVLKQASVILAERVEFLEKENKELKAKLNLA